MECSPHKLPPSITGHLMPVLQAEIKRLSFFFQLRDNNTAGKSFTCWFLPVIRNYGECTVFATIQWVIEGKRVFGMFGIFSYVPYGTPTHRTHLFIKTSWTSPLKQLHSLFIYLNILYPFHLAFRKFPGDKQHFKKKCPWKQIDSQCCYLSTGCSGFLPRGSSQHRLLHSGSTGISKLSSKAAPCTVYYTSLVWGRWMCG